MLDLKQKQSFVDLGCGNGLLVHILSEEGVIMNNKLKLLKLLQSACYKEKNTCR